MILVFVENRNFGKVRNLSLKGRVSYHNPKYFNKREHPIKCDKVIIIGDFPEIERIYSDKMGYPIEKGAGWFELSDGSSVRGKDKAIKAEAELHG